MQLVSIPDYAGDRGSSPLQGSVILGFIDDWVASAYQQWQILIKTINMANKNQQATAFLMYSALCEIQLDLYEHITLLNHFDTDLLNKHRNLKASFERTTKKAYSLFTEKEQLIFFDMIKVFQSLLEASVSNQDFSELMNLIKAWQKKEITVINSTQELIDTAKKAESSSTELEGHTATAVGNIAD